MRDTGLDLPAAGVEDGRVLWLEDVAGRPGTEFTLADHERFATALGRWQARGPLDAPWTSRRFLREYAASKPAPYELVDDDRAWELPLVRDCWPPGLRTGWGRLLTHRELLLATMERLPRTFAHLDVWVSNEIARPDGRTVLLDWAFAGDGAIGEDAGNHIPDAAFDLFWPAERIAELDAAVTAAYLAGLREAGRSGDPAQVRLGIVASCVEYAWLLSGDARAGVRDRASRVPRGRGCRAPLPAARAGAGPPRRLVRRGASPARSRAVAATRAARAAAGWPG